MAATPPPPAPAVAATAVAQDVEEKQKRGAPKKEHYPITNALKDNNGKLIVNAQNKLMTTPVEVKNPQGQVVQEGFDPFKHKLNASDFDSEVSWLHHRAHCCDVYAEKRKEQAEEFRHKAKIAETLGDEETRKNALKVANLRKKLAELETKLADSDFDMSILEELK